MMAPFLCCNKVSLNNARSVVGLMLLSSLRLLGTNWRLGFSSTLSGAHAKGMRVPIMKSKATTVKTNNPGFL
jgi:hypothetical protein